LDQFQTKCEKTNSIIPVSQKIVAFKVIEFFVYYLFVKVICVYSLVTPKSHIEDFRIKLPFKNRFYMEYNAKKINSIFKKVHFSTKCCKSLRLKEQKGKIGCPSSFICPCGLTLC